MNRSLRRFGALSAAALAASLALSACSPPNEQDSEKKFDTATEAPAGQATAASSATSSATATTSAAAELPGYADCQAAPVTEPATLTLDCVRLDDRVTSVQWDEWTAEGATGTGTRGSEKVDVELSEPTANEAGATVFTTVTVDGETVTP